MAINSKLKFMILAAMFLSGLTVLQAQTAGYFLDPNSDEPRFIQRLMWSGGTYSLHCEVILEMEKDGEYVNYLNKFTTDNFLEISLPPGNYRFRVIPYDVLGKPSTGTQWEPFKVFAAVKPELFPPEEELDYYNDRKGSKFEFIGKNIEPDAQVYFVNAKGERIVPVEIIRSDDGSGVRLLFNKDQLIDGEYDVFIVNPGGLETSIGGIDYKTYKEKFGLFHYIAGVSFMPAHQIYREDVSSEGMLYFLSARFGLISCMFSNNYIGMEFSFSKILNNNNINENTAGGYNFGYNFLFINWLLERKAAISFRIGVGFEMQPMDLSYSNIGVSFLYSIYKYLNVEAGINFTHKFIDKSGDIMPWVGLSFFF